MTTRKYSEAFTTTTDAYSLPKYKPESTVLPFGGLWNTGDYPVAQKDYPGVSKQFAEPPLTPEERNKSLAKKFGKRAVVLIVTNDRVYVALATFDLNKYNFSISRVCLAQEPDDQEAGFARFDEESYAPSVILQRAKFPEISDREVRVINNQNEAIFWFGEEIDNAQKTKIVYTLKAERTSEDALKNAAEAGLTKARYAHMYAYEKRYALVLEDLLEIPLNIPWQTMQFTRGDSIVKTSTVPLLSSGAYESCLLRNKNFSSIGSQNTLFAVSNQRFFQKNPPTAEEFSLMTDQERLFHVRFRPATKNDDNARLSTFSLLVGKCTIERLESGALQVRDFATHAVYGEFRLFFLISSVYEIFNAAVGLGSTFANTFGETVIVETGEDFCAFWQDLGFSVTSYETFSKTYTLENEFLIDICDQILERVRDPDPTKKAPTIDDVMKFLEEKVPKRTDEEELSERFNKIFV